MRHGPTAATRAGVFPVDEPLDERGLAAAALLGAALPAGWDALTSPALRCRQTAEAAGLHDASIDPPIAECDFGAWAGLSLQDIGEADAVAWMADPESLPPGGESLAAFAVRVSRWLDGQAQQDGRAVAFTHAGVVKTAVVHALGAPLAAFWRVDVAPLSVTELHAHDEGWTVTRVNCVSDSPRHSRNIRHARPRAGEAASS